VLTTQQGMDASQSERETLRPVSPVHRRTRLKIALGATLATLLAALASAFLLATASFGIGYGEMKIDTESRQLAGQLNRAGNIAFAFFLATEGVAAWLLLNAGLLPLKLHWLIKFGPDHCCDSLLLYLDDAQPQRTYAGPDD